jgi:hypothetical protein
MRVYQWLAAAVTVVALAAPASAQINMGGPMSANLTYNVINPSASTTTIAPQQTGLFAGSKLPGFFHWPSQYSNTPVIGASTFPAPGALPGLSYLLGFGYSTPGQ